MIYRENIVDKKITDLVRKYLNEGYYIVKSDYRNGVKLNHDERDSISVSVHHFTKPLEEIENTNKIYPLLLNISEYGKQGDTIIETGIYYTATTDTEYNLYSDSLEEIKEIARKTLFRQKNRACKYDYVQHLSKTLIKGFKKEVTLVKKTNGAKRQLINGFYINKNGKFLNLYYKSSNEHTSLAYGVKRLICI